MEDDSLSQQQQDELHKALNKLHSKVEVLEQRAQLNEIKFHYEDYKEVKVLQNLLIKMHD